MRRVWLFGGVVACLLCVTACGSDATPNDTGEQDATDSDDVANEPPVDEPAACTTVAARPGTVITTSGPVTGANVSATWSWKGVRYAEPPVGELRWKPPVAAHCVAEEVTARAFGAVCPQLSDGSVIGQEDCLTLNIWAPETASGAPVLVFIHGGGNVQGSAADPLYDGQELASRTGSVVVTVAYRLGALGYFANPGLDAESEHDVSGNYGILDQVEALRWVRNNIAGFGGSPTNVLVFGESGGAQDTLVHLVSPLSAGLFDAAIVESGGLYKDTIADVEADDLAVVRHAGCADASDVISCMRALPFATLVTVPTAVGPLDTEDLHFGPMIDGYVMTESPFTTLERGAHNHVPFVIGTNADETSAMVPTVTTAEAYETTVRALYGLAAGNALLTLYPAEDYSSPRKALIALTTDVIWTCPARRIAGLVADTQDEPVFRYHFTWKVPGASGLVYGSTHGLELPFVFRTFGAAADAGYVPAPADLLLSEAMQRYWQRLPARGDVNGDSDVIWPAYDSGSDPYLELGTTISAKAGLATENCDAIEALAAAAP